MQSFDTWAFALLTAGPDASGWMIGLATLLASAVVPLVALGLLAAWIKGRDRKQLLDAVASGLAGLGAVQVIGVLAYRPRPFELGLGRNLLHHLAENSFPSDHATLMFALAASFLLAGRRIGLVLLVLAAAVGWARVWLGVHWPMDILGGAVLGACCAALVRRLPARLALWDLAEKLWRRLVL